MTDSIKDFLRYWTYPVLRPRHFHAFGVGMPKSGTHSLDAIFSGAHRTWHEPRIVRFMELAKKRTDGELPEQEVRRLVRGLDRRLWLEFNSSWVNYFLLDLLVEEYPESKFIFTIRDCYSWLDSIVNQLLAREHGDYQKHFHQWYGTTLMKGEHAEGDRILAEKGLWSLDAWFRFWHEHNAGVIEKVPSDRLLVVRTFDIQTDIPRVARFLDIDEGSLNASRSHQFKAAKKFGLLSQIDPDYLQACADKHCKPLMDEYFPEIRSLADVRGYRPEDLAKQAADAN